MLATLSSECLVAFPQNTVERDGRLVWILGAASATKALIIL